MSTAPDIHTTLARRLVRARLKAILSQAEVAEQLGVSVRTVQNWEAGLTPKNAAKHRALMAFISEIENGQAA